MPSGQPFTRLCETLARPRHFGRVDLHLHTTFSDGKYTPAQVVDLARRSGLSAIAITDHDTLAGIAPAQQAASTALEVVPGVEITAEFHGRELHLLAYFFDPAEAHLTEALERLRVARIGRFHEMVARLGTLGIRLEDEQLSRISNETTLGRRHLAEMLVKAKKATSVREAFQRWLGDHGRAMVPKTRLLVDEAIRLVGNAGGVTSWAHPNDRCTRESLHELRDVGLNAIEAEYPSFRAGRVQELRRLANDLGLAVTGGSDCHGPDEPHRAVGACTISHDELQQLRPMIETPASV